MRNLKRVLSLALALVMVLGMMVIGTSAATFTDAEKITYTEAVDVMAAIGILKGNPNADGTFTFDPQGNLTREGAAKILAFVAMGEDADDYLTGTIEAPFSDVAADRWSAKYVTYCKNLKIIDGNGDGTFNPTGNISTVGFGKLLLGAIGIEGTYTGAGWENNVKEALAKADLDVITIDTTDITREEACEMALAAMQYSVTPDEYEVRYTDDTKETYTVIGKFADLFEATMYCKLLANDYAVAAGVGEGYYVQKAPAKDTLLLKNYGVSAAADDDAFGRPGVRYTSLVDEEFDLFFVDKALVTYTAPVKAADIAKAYAKFNWANGTSANDIVNNANYGKVVEVYSTVVAGTKTVTDVVVVEELLGKVIKVTEAKGEAKRNVTVAGMTFETESFAKDDVVLYTVADGEIQSMVAPATFTGKIESYNATLKTVTVGGKTYNYRAGFSLATDFTKSYTFTQYSDGSIVAQAETQAAAAAVSKDYVYVVNTQYVKGGAVDLVTATKNAAKATVIFADGTAGTIDLNIYKDATQVGKPDVVKMPAANGNVTKTNLDTIGLAAIENWFAYTVEADGTYTLAKIDAKYAKVLNADATLVKDNMATLGGKYTTKDTAITYVDTTAPNAVVTNMTGFVAASLDVEKTISEVTYSNLVLVTYAGPTATTVSAVYAVKQAPIATPDTTYAYAVKAGNAVAYGTEWTFAINGKQATYIIADGETVVPGALYTLTEGTYNYTVNAKNGDLTGTALVTVIDGNQVAISSGAVLTLSDKVNVYNVDETAEVVGEVKALEVGDVVDYIVANGKVTNIWVYGVDATVEADEDTFAAVLAKVPAGVTIALADGTYSAVTLDGSQSANLTIVGNGADTVVAGLTSSAAVNGLTLSNIKFTAGVALTGSVANVTVSGCQFVGSGEDDNAIALNIAAHTGKLVIADNVIDGFDYPMQLTGSATTVISNNILKNSYDRAIRFLQVLADVVVTIEDNAIVDACDSDNEVFKVGYSGYEAVAEGAEITFEGNTYNGAAWDPADIDEASSEAIAYTIADGQ